MDSKYFLRTAVGLLLFLCSLPILHGQNWQRLEYFEKHIRALADTMSENAIDLDYPYRLLQRNSSVPKWRWDLPHSDFNDAAFQELIDKIENLSITKEVYFSDTFAKITRTIENQSNLAKRTFLNSYLQVRFIRSGDSDIVKDVYSKFSVRDVLAKALDDQSDLFQPESAEIMKIGGDFLKIQEPVSSLYSYLYASWIFDSLKDYGKLAEIEESIASLYSYREYGIFYSKSVEHLEKAAKYFALANDPTSSLVCKLRSAEAAVNIDPRPHTIRDFAENAEDFYFQNKTSNFNEYATELNANQKKASIFSVAYAGLHDSSLTVKFYANMLLAQYFVKNREYKIAEVYYRSSLFYAVVDGYPDYHMERVASALNSLAWIYSKEEKAEKSSNVSDLNITLCTKSGNPLGLAWAYISAAAFSMNLGSYPKAEALLDSASSLINRLRGRGINVSFYQRKIHSYQSFLFKKQLKLNAAEEATSLFLDEEKENVDQGNELINMEADYTQSKYEESIQKKIENIEALLQNIRRLSCDTERLNKARSALLAQNQSLGFEIEKRLVQLNQKDATIVTKQRKIQNLDSSLASMIRRNWITLGVAVVIIIILIVLFYKIITHRNKLHQARLVAERKNLVETSRYLNAKSKSLTHNYRNLFTNILLLAERGEVALTEEYVKKCKDYLQKSMNSKAWVENRWTLHDELQLLNTFLPVGNVLSKDITIVEKIHDEIKDKIDKIHFESDVFDTLLSNSLKAFDGKTDNFLFTVSIIKNGRIIEVTVTDNGKGGVADDFILEDSKDERGLKILRSKFETIAKLKPDLKIQRPFVISSTIGEGTTVKMVLPYEEIHDISG